MKKIVRLFLAVLLVISLPGCSRLLKQDKVQITVITKATETDFWRAVRNGCNSAAGEYNVNLIFQGPEGEEDYKTQNQMLEEAIDRGTGAIILSAIDREKSTKIVEKAAARGIYVVIIDSGINSTIPEVIISTDNYASGKKAAQAMAEEKTGPLNIGIVNMAQGTANGQEREKGFTDTIELLDGAQITGKVSVDSNLDSAKQGTYDLLEKYPEINALVAFNEYTTLGAGTALSEMELGNKIKMYGFDNNNTAIQLLEEGNIDGLMVQNQFAIGYLGVEAAYNLITERYIAEREIYMEAALVERNNLFEEGIQKIVFPVEKK
jgi:ribose transport system substrate-binding protein